MHIFDNLELIIALKSDWSTLMHCFTLIKIAVNFHWCIVLEKSTKKTALATVKLSILFFQKNLYQSFEIIITEYKHN